MYVGVSACVGLSKRVCPAAPAGCHFTLAAWRRGINHSLCAYNEPHWRTLHNKNTLISIILPSTDDAQVRQNTNQC